MGGWGVDRVVFYSTAISCRQTPVSSHKKIIVVSFTLIAGKYQSCLLLACRKEIGLSVLESMQSFMSHSYRRRETEVTSLSLSLVERRSVLERSESFLLQSEEDARAVTCSLLTARGLSCLLQSLFAKGDCNIPCTLL